jgi:hypothetical protein
MTNARRLEGPAWAAVGFILVLSAACAPIKVKTDFDQRANFTQYRTFKVAPCQAPTCTAGRAPLGDRIAGALHEQLQARGLQPAASSPDLVVVYAATTHTKYDLIQPTGDPPWGGLGGDIWTDEVREGTLVLSFLDARTNHTVWTTRAHIEQDFTSPAMVQQTVAKALATYPPGG